MQKNAISGTKKQASFWMPVWKGLLISVAFSAVFIVLFALLLLYIRMPDGLVRIINQVIKLGAVALGCIWSIGRGGSRGLMKGAAIGCLYMGLGVLVYALCTGQSPNMAAYASDVAMGVASGGLIGMLLANLTPKQK